MMTRREKLLMRPWQLRRYNNHKMKVINAAPIVDFGPPPQHRHVTVKLKKLQKERERQMKIEEDNFKLLQHLNAIMTKKRVDNHWKTEPPNFLRRVGIYNRTRTPTPCLESVASSASSENNARKSKCLACVPQAEKPILVPEARIPWEPPKKILTRRQSRSAVCPVVSDFDMSRPPVRTEAKKIAAVIAGSSLPKTSNNDATGRKSHSAMKLPTITKTKALAGMEKSQQTVVVRQGQLQIVVNFPMFAEVKLIRGKCEKYLQRDLCGCKNLQPAK